LFKRVQKISVNASAKSGNTSAVTKPISMLFPELEKRATLEQQWLDLTRLALPEAAVSRGWPIHKDHCFQRVLLDNACGGHWAATILRTPAYRHAPGSILLAAINLGLAVLGGTADLHLLNERSLQWRGKHRSADNA
jgi:hypothetical protein